MSERLCQSNICFVVLPGVTGDLQGDFVKLFMAGEKAMQEAKQKSNGLVTRRYEHYAWLYHILAEDCALVLCLFLCSVWFGGCVFLCAGAALLWSRLWCARVSQPCLCVRVCLRVCEKVAFV